MCDLVSIDTIAPNCIVCFEKIAFLYFGDRQTDEQTNRWTGPMHEAALAVASGGLISRLELRIVLVYQRS